MKTGEKSDRILYMDLLRIFSIFAMMVLHTASANWSSVPIPSTSWYALNLYDGLVRFCVPVFVMISGAMFLNPAKSITVKSLFSKNILRIVVAFLFWSTAYALVSSPISLTQLVKNIMQGHFHLWFLFTLVGLYLATPVLRAITKDETATKYYLISIFALCFLVKATTNLWGFATVLAGKASLDFFAGYVGYFLLGHYLFQHQLSQVHRHWIYGFGIFATIFTVVATHQASRTAGIAFDGWYSYFAPNVALTATAVFVFFQYKVAPIQWSHRATNLICLTSKLSFGMYLVHDFFNMLLRHFSITALSYNPFWAVPLHSIFIFFASFFVAYALSKLPLCNKFLM